MHSLCGPPFSYPSPIMSESVIVECILWGKNMVARILPIHATRVRFPNISLQQVRFPHIIDNPKSRPWVCASETWIPPPPAQPPPAGTWVLSSHAYSLARLYRFRDPKMEQAFLQSVNQRPSTPHSPGGGPTKSRNPSPIFLIVMTGKMASRRGPSPLGHRQCGRAEPLDLAHAPPPGPSFLPSHPSPDHYVSHVGFRRTLR